MATQIRGNKQIKNITIENSQLVDGTIELNKLKDGSELLKRNGTVSATGDFDLGSHNVKNLAAPVDDNDAVRKADLDAATSGAVVNREIPSGTANGTNTEFTLANLPNLGSEQVFLNGSMLNAGANCDYVVDESTITFTIAPQAGDVILVNYITDGVVLNVDVTNTLNQFNARLTTAEGELFTAQGDISSLSSDVDGVDTRLTSAESDIVAVEGSVSTLQSTVSSVQSSVSTISSSLTSEQSARIAADDGLDARITPLESGATTLGNRVTAVEGDIGSLETADSDMDIRVGVIEDGLQAETTARISAVNGLNTRVTTLENSGAGFSGSYNDLTNKPTIPENFSDLLDVDITSPQTNQYLIYNGTDWVNSDVPVAGAVSSGIVSTGSQSFAGTKTFTAPSTTEQALIVTSVASSTGVLMSWKDTAGTTWASIDGYGRITAKPSNFTTTGVGVFALSVYAGLATAKGMLIRGAASHTANLFEVQNSAATVLTYINSNGSIGLPAGGVSTPSIHFTASTNMGIYRKSSNVMGFVANGQPALLVDGSSGVGRLGVGDTATVVSRLQLIDDGLTTTSGITLGTNSSTYVQLHRSANNILKVVGGLIVTNINSASACLAVTGVAGQSGSLLDLRIISDVSPRFAVDSVGTLVAGEVPVARVSGLATVATSGSYNDLSDKPSIPSLTGYATESYVNTAVSDLVASAPSVLNTLNELATALGNDANFSTTITNSLAAKADSSSLATVATSGSYNDLSDKPSIPSISGLASEVYVDAAVASKADSVGLATVATSGDYSDLTNKPAIPTGVMEVPSGDVDGTNTQFVLSDVPMANTLQVFLNGLLQMPVIGEDEGDYNLSADTITFTQGAPEVGWKVFVYYFV